MSETESILRLPAVRERTGLSRTEIYRRMARGDFPKCVDLGARAVGWSASSIDRWIAERLAAPRAKKRIPRKAQAPVAA